MKRILTLIAILHVGLPLWAQPTTVSATQLRRLLIKNPLVCAGNLYVLTWVTANSRFECLAQTGGVTSVSFTGGLISVANPTTTPAFTVAGTSGGIPYFNSATSWLSSGALGANLPLFGGGAGAAPIAGTRTGNTTQLATWTGATTASRCVHTDASGNLTIASTDCGTGAGTTIWQTAGSTTATEGTANFVALPGVLLTGSNPAGKFQLTVGPDTSFMQSLANDQSGAPTYCRSTTGNATGTCALTPTLTAYATGMRLTLSSNFTNVTTYTINVDTLGAKSVLGPYGGALTAGMITADKPVTIVYNGTNFNIQGDGGGVTSGSPFYKPTVIDDSTGWSNYGDWTTNPPTKDTTNAGSVILDSTLVNVGGQYDLKSRVAAVTAPYSKILMVAYSLAAASTTVGIVDGHLGVLFTDGTKAVTCAIQYSTGALGTTWSYGTNEFATSVSYGAGSTGGFTTWATTMSPAFPPSGVLYFRLSDDNTGGGSARKCDYSPDGTSWRNVFATTRTTYLTATSVGYFVDAIGKPTGATIIAKGYE